MHTVYTWYTLTGPGFRIWDVIKMICWSRWILKLHPIDLLMWTGSSVGEGTPWWGFDVFFCKFLILTPFHLKESSPVLHGFHICFCSYSLSTVLPGDTYCQFMGEAPWMSCMGWKLMSGRHTLHRHHVGLGLKRSKSSSDRRVWVRRKTGKSITFYDHYQFQCVS